MSESEYLPEMMPQLSIVIVNWNTRDLLRDCLKSIFASPRDFVVEVIVVDNDSNDDSVRMCHETFPAVKVLQNAANLGFGRANNQGIDLCSAEIALLLNSDTIVPSGALEEMLKTMTEDPSIALLGCRLLNADGSFQQSCMRFPSIPLVAIQELMLYKLSSKLPRLFVEPPWKQTPADCDWVYAAAVMIRTSAVKDVGGFDPNIWMYSEEMELCYRLKKQNWRIRIDPAVKIFHLGEGSWRKTSYSPTFLKMTGLLYFFKTHHSYGAYLAAKWLTLCGATLRLFMWGVWTQLHFADSASTRRGLAEISSHFLFIKKMLTHTSK
jgi:GT2 family glycosyltransferase